MRRRQAKARLAWDEARARLAQAEQEAHAAEHAFLGISEQLGQARAERANLAVDGLVKQAAIKSREGDLRGAVDVLQDALQRNPEHSGLWTVAATAKAGPVKLVYVLREQPLWLACSPRTGKDVVKKLSDAIAAMKKDGTHKRLIDAMEKTVAR